MSARTPAVVPGMTDHSATFLAELSQEFASSLDIGETLKHAIDRFMVYLDAEAASIFLLDDDTSALSCRECAGPVDVRGLRLAPGQGIVGQTVAHNTAKIVRDVSHDASFAATVDADTGFATRSILCVPLAVRGRCLGALELLNKRGGDGLFDRNDLQLATVVAAAAALAIHNAHMAGALLGQERVRKELELARHIQESLLPVREGSRSAVHGVNLPAREMSGDFYDFMTLADGRIYFALADVSGKGMNAALLMAKTTSLLRCLAKHASGASALLRQVNDEICENATRGMFVTLIAGFLDPRSGRIELANAGHPPALLQRTDGSFVELAAQAPPLGVVAAMDFPAVEISLDGGVLYLYTDGISESAVGAGHELGAPGLKRMIEAASPVAADLRLGALLRAWRAAGYQARDDVTLLLIELPAVQASASQCMLALRFAADPVELKGVRGQVQAAAQQLGWQGKFVDDVVMAVNEACMNIIEHAYAGDRSGEIELAIHNNENEIEVVLTDFAPPIDIEAIRARDLDELRPGGLGTHFMATLMDRCVYGHLVGSAGNVLRMIKRLPAGTGRLSSPRIELNKDA